MRTLIVGGGLSGLALADALEAQGKDYLLLEARARFGGRIETRHEGGAGFDLGPAWFWDGQPRIAALIARVKAQKFEQFSAGALSFEDAQGTVQRGRGFASMQGSWRLAGGLAGLTDALASGLPDHRKRLGAQVTALERSTGICTATLQDGPTIEAERVVLALPPRVAAQIAFTPALPAASIEAMRNVSTWMAGQAKAVAVYDTPFWREGGLSGDATSRCGPMAEIHDTSPAAGGPYALFGFIGIPPHTRLIADELRRDIVAQLVRLFGPQAASPREVFIKDWAQDVFTATQADAAPLYAHPDYGLPHAMAGLWDGQLICSGTETAATFGGYLEGALEAAAQTLAQLTSTPHKNP